MTYQVQLPLQYGNLSAAFFSFSGTPTTGNPLTPSIVGSSSGFSPVISNNDIQLQPGEYLLRFFGAITRNTNSHNIIYQWKLVGGNLFGAIGSTNREIAPGNYTNSLDSADAHLKIGSTSSVQIIMTTAETDLTLDTVSTHAIIWRVPT